MNSRPIFVRELGSVAILFVSSEMRFVRSLFPSRVKYCCTSQGYWLFLELWTFSKSIDIIQSYWLFLKLSTFSKFIYIIQSYWLFLKLLTFSKSIYIFQSYWHVPKPLSNTFPKLLTFYVKSYSFVWGKRNIYNSGFQFTRKGQNSYYLTSCSNI